MTFMIGFFKWWWRNRDWWDYALIVALIVSSGLWVYAKWAL